MQYHRLEMGITPEWGGASVGHAPLPRDMPKRGMGAGHVETQYGSGSEVRGEGGVLAGLWKFRLKKC